jgi:hypothetical protein
LINYTFHEPRKPGEIERWRELVLWKVR